MVKVLFLYPRTLDAKSSVGGVAEFLCSLIPALKNLDVDSVIYAGDKSVNQLTKPSHTLVNTTVYNGPFIKPGWWVSKSRLSHVLEVCRLENIDVIHAQGTYTAGFMAMKIHEHTGIPYVVTSHSDILPQNSKRISRRNVRQRCRKVLRHAAVVTHLTPRMEAVSHELYPAQEKSVVVANGIDCGSWQPFITSVERNYLLCMGRLERGKGFEILIDMFAKLIGQGMTTSLVIAGKGSEEPALFEQIKKLGLGLVTDFTDIENMPEKSVIFTGYVRDDFKKRLVAESKMVLFATQTQFIEEAFGMVQLEAMAAGKPILASDINASRYLEQLGMQCRLIPASDVDAWAMQARNLLQDAASRKNLGQANLEAIRQFDWKLIAKKYRDVYADLA